ncbi:hypothetical protein ACFU7Z_31050, partial [Kitasatospora sp. NPDC057518]|uniref:hypothetical protein n=1 Tax=Kitasatospora sp. NPDC057518 TaxID=3346155 RepID=UPI0036806711
MTDRPGPYGPNRRGLLASAGALLAGGAASGLPGAAGSAGGAAPAEAPGRSSAVIRRGDPRYA